MQLIECVPNFSEGRDPAVIEKIAAEIASVEKVWLLNVDSGKAANRTVMTFVGEPAAVVEAAFKAIKKAGELIDMRIQTGEHPRMGATDVCPLIPLHHTTMEETDRYAKQLAARVGEELGIPVYLYEASQPDNSRSNLSVIRSGGYEGFFHKIKLPGWRPDYGPAQMDARRGATAIGARNFLLAYNINLNTRSVKDASTIAGRVRESGVKIKRADGSSANMPGTLKSVKAIGWLIEEYGCAQVSMNLTDINTTPIHQVFEEVTQQAQSIGVKVTGSELIGLIPLKPLLDAGEYYRNKFGHPTNATETQLIQYAIDGMGLGHLTAFDPQQRIIEYQLQSKLN
jgi:glutamate formiminotransferase/formiminotetrahydrofolate cyclodeaminase